MTSKLEIHDITHKLWDQLVESELQAIRDGLKVR